MPIPSTLGAHAALAAARELERVIMALIATHPKAADALAVYEKAESEDYDLALPLDDRAFEYARQMRERLLQMLRRTAERD